jgi:hypothetical protein
MLFRFTLAALAAIASPGSAQVSWDRLAMTRPPYFHRENAVSLNF